MVSKNYTAETFYKKQNQGKVAKNMPKKQKLHKVKGENQFYLWQEKTNGKDYKQKVKPNDKVYARENAVSKYESSRDRDVVDVRHKKETGKQHSPYTHKYDRKAKTTGREYKV